MKKLCTETHKILPKTEKKREEEEVKVNDLSNHIIK